jgi:hypothetical protein
MEAKFQGFESRYWWCYTMNLEPDIGETTTVAQMNGSAQVFCGFGIVLFVADTEMIHDIFTISASPPVGQEDI